MDRLIELGRWLGSSDTIRHHATNAFSHWRVLLGVNAFNPILVPPLSKISAGTAETMDRERLSLLFDRLHLPLYRTARRLTRESEEARDLVQEAFLRAARNPESVPLDDNEAEAWIYRVLVNLCRDRQRRLRVRRRASLSELALPKRQEMPSSENEILARDAVQTALQHLAPRRRAILVLCELENLTVGEVAQRLGLAKVTVRWHLAKARRELAQIFERIAQKQNHSNKAHEHE